MSRLKDAVGDMDELTHHGADDDHGRLSGLGQTCSKRLAPGGFIKSRHGRHVEGFAQQGMSHFGEPCFAVDAAAREMLTRIEAAAHWRSLSKRVGSA